MRLRARFAAAAVLAVAVTVPVHAKQPHAPSRALQVLPDEGEAFSRTESGRREHADREAAVALPRQPPGAPGHARADGARVPGRARVPARPFEGRRVRPARRGDARGRGVHHGRVRADLRGAARLGLGHRRVDEPAEPGHVRDERDQAGLAAGRHADDRDGRRAGPRAPSPAAAGLAAARPPRPRRLPREGRVAARVALPHGPDARADRGLGGARRRQDG